jgi:hypothetical protein
MIRVSRGSGVEPELHSNKQGVQVHQRPQAAERHILSYQYFCLLPKFFLTRDQMHSKSWITFRGREVRQGCTILIKAEDEMQSIREHSEGGGIAHGCGPPLEGGHTRYREPWPVVRTSLKMQNAT